MSDDLVKVAVRIRPLIQSEVEKGCQTCLSVIPGEQQIHIQSSDKFFTFNYVFPAEVSQEDFYNTAIKNMVSNIFEGYNVTILAYGQTGSGKTFSMGTNYNENDANCGIIPRAVNDIFEQISAKEKLEYKVTVAFMELYKEQLYDLLAKKPRSQCMVDIREDGKNIKIVGLSEIPVTNTQETLHCLANGSLNRATGATAMNVQSSRSHAIFTLSVYQQKRDDPNTAKFAKFHFVDLAGSERSKKTQATGERFKEGVNINKGLLALGNVISQLGEGGNSTYIGYRDSKLTRLLQDSLGGNSVTLMIACVSPADYNIDETTSTLRYADRAKKIKNKPIVNQDPHVAEVNHYRKIIQELKSALFSKDGGGNLCPQEHAELMEKNESLQRKLRGLTETLNLNLVEMVHMHELSELAEKSREKLKNAISAILEDCENLLKDFDNDLNDIENHKVKLENICFKIIMLQKEQKQAVEELVSHELSVESAKNDSLNSDSILSNPDENGVHNETYDIDEKHEEHTLQQAERVDEVQYINRQLAIKEELVSNLLKNSSQLVEYQKELEEMEQEIKSLQSEKEELIQALRNAQTNNACAKLSETRRKKVQELEKQITELSRKCLEQNKIIKGKEKSDVQIKNLSNEIMALKQTKVKLIKSMRIETDKFNKWKRLREQELSKLKDQDRKRVNQISKLQAEHDKQKNVLKRKLEEAQAIQKRLKNALDSQKKVATLRREKNVNSKEDVSSWVNQELEVLMSTVDAECTIERLKADKAVLANQLAELQLNHESRHQAQIEELVEFVELRNIQINDLEQHVKESKQENKTKSRWHVISSMADAKDALKILFEITASNRKDFSILKSQLDDVMETNEKLKATIEKYQLGESNSKMRRERLGMQLNNDSTIEKNQIIQNLQKQLNFYKEKCENLENKVLTERDINITEKKPMYKAVKSVIKQSVNPYDSFTITDDSLLEEDDDENDPDWQKTPLYTRIRKQEHELKQVARENKITLKRSSGGQVKCNCKTQCQSRICSCRKNEVSCENCNCSPLLCTNRSVDTRRTLFSDGHETNDGDINIEVKKQKLETES
ncbi:chromosome-associated kinesin KIF4A [Phymastichus coffea]|uniref:chromosome-associated kinesin KIF4A n=1 Tax=Phymastichus coffea TaxID=108790 RepID=UPI00273ACCC1|nr:chromosome-associated kinesin KIF4A [Phymastichus coffea]